MRGKRPAAGQGGEGGWEAGCIVIQRWSDLACECVVCDVLMSNVDAELFADVRKSQGTVTAGVSGVEL